MSTSLDSDLGARPIDGIIVAGGASTTTTHLDYSSGASFTYDSAKIEFANGRASLKNQYDSSVVCAATFATAKTLDYSRDGGSTAVIKEVGTISVTSGKLVLNSGANSMIAWDADGNTPKGSIGCVRLRVTPHYTGNAPANGSYFYQHHKELNSVANYLLLQHFGANQVTQSRNNATTTLHSGSNAFSATSGQEYEFEINYDNTTGTFNTYRDATRISTASSSSAAATYAEKLIGRITMGDNTNDSGTPIPAFSVRDLMIFDSVQNTGATRTTGYALPTGGKPYLTTDPTITLTTGIAANGLVSFSATTYASGSDAVKFHILVGAQARYWNGSAWANSDGTAAQSNTAAEINTNAGDLEAGTYKVVAVLESDTGSTTPSISSVTMVTS